MSTKIDFQTDLKLLFEAIQEYVQHQIDIRRKKIDFITTNYNLIHNRAKRDEMATYVTEIQQLNELLVEIAQIFNRVIELSKQEIFL